MEAVKVACHAGRDEEIFSERGYQGLCHIIGFADPARGKDVITSGRSKVGRVVQRHDLAATPI